MSDFATKITAIGRKLYVKGERGNFGVFLDVQVGNKIQSCRLAFGPLNAREVSFKRDEARSYRDGQTFRLAHNQPIFIAINTGKTQPDSPYPNKDWQNIEIDPADFNAVFTPPKSAVMFKRIRRSK